MYVNRFVNEYKNQDNVSDYAKISAFIASEQWIFFFVKVHALALRCVFFSSKRTISFISYKH